MADPKVAAAVTETSDGTRLALEVRPGAREAAFPAGFDPWRGRIGIRVAAPAQDGRANADVIATVARFFDRPERDVAVVAGPKSTQKTVAVRGVDAASAVQRLEAAL